MKTKTVITTTIIDDSTDEKEMIDWQELVSTLHSRSTLVRIAKKVNCDERTLSNLKQGITPEPKFSVGVQLLALHGLKHPQQHKEMGLI